MVWWAWNQQPPRGGRQREQKPSEVAGRKKVQKPVKCVSCYRRA